MSQDLSYFSGPSTSGAGKINIYNWVERIERGFQYLLQSYGNTEQNL